MSRRRRGSAALCQRAVPLPSTWSHSSVPAQQRGCRECRLRRPTRRLGLPPIPCRVRGRVASTERRPRATSSHPSVRSTGASHQSDGCADALGESRRPPTHLVHHSRRPRTGCSGHPRVVTSRSSASRPSARSAHVSLRVARTGRFAIRPPTHHPRRYSRRRGVRSRQSPRASVWSSSARRSTAKHGCRESQRSTPPAQKTQRSPTAIPHRCSQP